MSNKLPHYLNIVETNKTKPIYVGAKYVHVNTNWSFVLKYIYFIHLGSNYFNEVIYDLWEVAYQQYQIWQVEDVDNKTSFNKHLTLFCLSKIEILKIIYKQNNQCIKRYAYWLLRHIYLPNATVIHTLITILQM